MTQILYYDAANPRYHFGINGADYIFLEDQVGVQKTYSSNQSHEKFNQTVNSLVTPFFPMNTSLKRDSGILPPGVRFLGANYVVFERPPSYQNVFYVPYRVEDMTEVHEEYDSDDELLYREDTFDIDENTSVYRLPIPWQLYVAVFDQSYRCVDVYMYFMNTSLFSTDQQLYIPPLPNFYTNGLLCRPMFDSMHEIERYEPTVKGVIESAYDWIWNNGTNNDLTENLAHLAVQQIEHPIFKLMPEELLYKFTNMHNDRYMYPDLVSPILKYWEQISMDESINAVWPNPSRSKHFDHNESLPSDYFNYLGDYISHSYYQEFDEEIEEDVLQDMINNGDYNSAGYRHYLIDLNLYHPKPYWADTMNYSSALNNIIKTIQFGTQKSNIHFDVSRMSTVLS
jgi:hypothetical protein